MGELTSVALVVEECGGLDKLEALQNHENEQIYHKVAQMIDTYFSNVCTPSCFTYGCITRFITFQFLYKPPLGHQIARSDDYVGPVYVADYLKVLPTLVA